MQKILFILFFISPSLSIYLFYLSLFFKYLFMLFFFLGGGSSGPLQF